MDGQIWVESELGRGSTFHFTARFKPAEAAPAGRPSREPVPGTRVLVVDDNATSRDILEEMLTNWRMQPVCLASVPEAIDALTEAREEDQPFRLVVADASMPDADGFALAEHVKVNPDLGAAVIMMLTSVDCPEDIGRCQGVGVTSYLLKPVKQSELFDAIALGLGVDDLEARGAVMEASDQKRHRPLEVLLAEDSLVNQTLAVALLKKQGHQVTVANNGREAVAATQSRDFDLVLMDVQMPEMDGLEATASIRHLESHTGKHVPIIAMTAHAMQGDRERCLERGMDGYISKPITADQLYEVIEKVAFPPAEAPRTAAGSGDDAPWDSAEALEAVAGDTSLLKEVVEAIVQESPGLLAEMHRAVEAGDAPALAAAAHKLKSSVDFVGARRVFETVRRLEQMGGDDQMQDAADVLAELDELIESLIPALEQYVQQAGAAPQGP
jgi:CheY-like chemotaxis protein